MEQAAEEIPKVWVKCVGKLPDGTDCSYCWRTRTKLQYISCPNCRHTNKITEAIKAYEEGCYDGKDNR